MKKILYTLCIASALLLAGCDEFLDVNTSKDSPITITVDQAIPTACFYAAQLCYDHSEYGVYLSQALTTGGKSQTGSYPYSQGWEFLGVNRHPMWRRHFYDLGANINKMNQIATDNGNLNAVLIGRTIMLGSTLFTTDAFGDMPRSESYQKSSPAYDMQADIYDWMFEEADELIKLYEDTAWTKCPTNMPISQKMDRIYAGDLKKWEAYAKALRCRLWLRKLPNWDNTPATCNKIIAMVDDILNSGNWYEPLYHYDGGKTEQNCPWGPYAPVINSWESRGNRLASSIPTTFFAKAILCAYPNEKSDRGVALDPRAKMIMTPRPMGSTANSTSLRYLESNIGMDNSMKVNYYPDLYAADAATNPYTQNTGYIALFTTEELLFIKAEAQYWAGDKNGAYNTTCEAVRRNFQRYGVTEADLSGNAAKRMERFWEVKLPGAATFTIGDLMQQKYIAMYLQPEQWTDMRRYNYSSKTNGIQYDNCFVYTVYKVHNQDKKKWTANDFTGEYSLRRPYNLYEPYWNTFDDYGDYGVNAELSPNAWINRLNADTETETKYNKGELDRIGYYTVNANGEKVLDYRVLKRRLIWAKNTCGKAVSSDPQITWQ